MTDSRKGYVRMRTLQAVVLLIFGVIILRLAYIQLIDPKYEKLARGNALRHVVQYPPRGEIFDRNGKKPVNRPFQTKSPASTASATT